MKYKCSHCNHVFELADREFHRCPNCFWTTSLVPAEAGASQLDPQPKIISPSSEQQKAHKPFPKGIMIFLIAAGLIGGLSFIFIKSGISFSLPSISLPKLPTWAPKADVSKSKSASTAKQKSAKQLESLLTNEERAQLVQSFQISIPRKLNEDEEEILKKQVSFPAKLSEKPKLAVWKKEDFEKMLDSEQKKRKVMLGWLYSRSLAKVFEANYLPGAAAFDQGDYVQARNSFIKSLAFPVYQENVQRYRAVVLVMLRTYVNDVIGKIATLNQYLSVQNSLTEVHGIFESYQALFPVLELQEWDRALFMITELKKRIAAFESRPQEARVDYPASFGQIDSELQAAIQAEATPKSESTVSLRALTIDIDLKEKVVRQNTANELSKVQKQYEQAISKLQQKDWEGAREILKAIEAPPELVDEAKKKLALIERAFAVEETDVSKD